MTAFLNTSVNNNNASLLPNYRTQEQPKFDIGLAQNPEATVSNFAPLVSSNSSVETKKFPTVVPSFQIDQAVPEQSAPEQAGPEATAATGNGKTVDPNLHRFPSTPYVHNSWNRPYTPPAPWSPPVPWSPAPKQWSPTTPVGNAWNPNPVANPTPWAGIPNSVAHKPFAHTAEVAGTLQQQNWGNPNITSGHVANQFNLNQNQAVTVNRLASGNGNTWEIPTATAGQLNNLLGNGFTTPGVMRDLILRAADTASFNHRANLAAGGITFDGYNELMNNAGAVGSRQSFANIAGTNWWEGMPHSISPGELQARGLSFDHNGHFSVSQFADIARRAHFG
jgi:hypothetical protein